MKKRELRFVFAANVRAARADDQKPAIEGYAAVFNEVADLGFFREVIKPGAFTRCLGDKPDVRCLFNHDPNMVLGRTLAGTLTLKEDSKGLFFRCEPPDTSYARDLMACIERGDVDQCSFAFSVEAENWQYSKNAEGDREALRELTDLNLYDVSPVTYPAYEGTSVGARAMWPDGMPPDLEQRLLDEPPVDDAAAALKKDFEQAEAQSRALAATL